MDKDRETLWHQHWAASKADRARRHEGIDRKLRRALPPAPAPLPEAKVYGPPSKGRYKLR